MKHKHSELIKAWADGAEIETRSPSYGVHDWKVEKYPNWENPSWEYRIKPEPKTDLTTFIKDLEINGFNFRFINHYDTWICAMPTWLIEEAEECIRENI